MNKKKNSALQFILFNFLIGILIGMSYMLLLPDSFWEAGGFYSLWLFAIMALFSVYFHIFIHEAGHGIFGALCGFRFVSFRIGSLILMKTETGLRFSAKGGIRGIGGQCLMCPPENLADSRTPVLYHLGGILMNALFSVTALVGYLLIDQNPVAQTLCLLLFSFGFYFILTNGIPMIAGGIPNDGYNAYYLRKSAEVRHSFVIQLRIACALTDGKRLRELPLEWFDLPRREALSNPQVCMLLFLRGDYFMDRMELDAAYDIYDFAVTQTAALPIHLAGACAELLFIELISGQYVPENFRRHTENLPANFDILSYLQSMAKRNPSSARVLYTYEALYRHDLQKAYEYWLIFDTHCKNPQFTGVMEGEKELMALAQSASARCNPQGHV